MAETETVDVQLAHARWDYMHATFGGDADAAAMAKAEVERLERHADRRRQ